MIDHLLCSRGSLIEDRIEAAGVLAQITSPWISDNHKIQHLDQYVYNMVNALTGMNLQKKKNSLTLDFTNFFFFSFQDFLA